MVTDYTQYNVYDIVSSPGFSEAIIQNGKAFYSKNYLRKKIIKNLFNF